MSTSVFGQREVFGCSRCHGMFVDFETLGALTSVKVDKGRIDLEPIVRLLCPTCGQSLEQMSINRVRVDVCATHGVWFDKTELAAFSAVVKPG